MTHTNYRKASDLLIEHFGQLHKIIGAYMKSLLELPRPENSTHSLQCFNDKLETLIRGLESLGQCQRNMARDHGNRQWKLNELRDAIQKEVNILQEGETTEVYFPTASFFTGSRNSPQKQKKKAGPTVDQAKSFGQKITCPFCGDQHSTIDCKNVETRKKTQVCERQKTRF